MNCPVCSYPHASLGIPCGSCGGTSHAAPIIAESATPIVPSLPEIPQQLGAAIIGFAGLPTQALPEPIAVAVIEEVVAPAVEVAAPVQAEHPLQQPESVTVN